MTEIDQYPILDDADGVVLVWSRKTLDAVAAQVNKVEPKLPGPDPAPGMIAHLTDSSGDALAVSVSNWPVVRFASSPDGRVVVVDEDADSLQRFMRSVLDRKLKRRQSADDSKG
jgi:hypothetical protein